MEFSCPICEENDTNYLFKKLNIIDGIYIFYTYPNVATKYHNHSEILNHFSCMLKEIDHASIKWKWVFNSKDFKLKYATHIKTAISITRLISEIKADLHEIIIMNPTWHINYILKIVTPFLKKDICEKIKFKLPNKKTK